MTDPLSIRQKRILVVEDEFFICEEMTSAFREEGAEIVGPAASVDAAIELIETDVGIDGAVLDISLQGRMSFPVAQLLRERAIPFVFATGYDAEIIPQDLSHIVRCEKPVDPQAVAEALFGKLGDRTPADAAAR